MDYRYSSHTVTRLTVHIVWVTKYRYKEYDELRRRYWGKHFWGIGYGAWSTGNITDKMVEEYLKDHKTSANDTTDFELE